MTRFTKGPWISTKIGYENYSVNGHNGVEICSAWRVENARLISCAPELLEAVENLLDYIVTEVQETCEGNKCRQSWCSGCFSSADKFVSDAIVARDNALLLIKKAKDEL